MFKIQKDISLKDYSTFKIGGKAKYFIAVENLNEIKKAIQFAQKQKIPFFILGGGSNTLFADKGYQGLMIKIQNSKLEIKNSKIIAGASVPLNKLIRVSLNKGLTGLEWAAGIPGEVGGAVYGNAGAFGSSMADIVKSVEAINIQYSTFNIQKFNNQACQFSYRNSLFKKNKKYIIIEVELELKKGNKKEIQKKIKENFIYRKEHHPLEYPSIGSIFENSQFTIHNSQLLKKFPDLKQFQKRGKIPAAYLINECDLKGKKIGGAQVSEKHPNFIVNAGDARTEDVIILISLIKQKVRDKFGIELEEEIVLVPEDIVFNF